MKNTDYLVYLVTKNGATTKFARDSSGWVQTSPAGTRRRCTAEQVLNHLLPALVLGDSVARTEVRWKRGKHFLGRIERLRWRALTGYIRTVESVWRSMVFIVLEGFSGTGKTSLAIGLEKRGWIRLQESAHAVPRDVPVADRADTAADFSHLGATMMYSSVISMLRLSRTIVSVGYLLGDLAYAKIRYELKKSDAYPDMVRIVKRVLEVPGMRPDLYILLKAEIDTINHRQMSKDERERNVTEFFRTRYYTALAEVHHELNEENTEVVETDSNEDATLQTILEILGRRKVISA